MQNKQASILDYPQPGLDSGIWTSECKLHPYIRSQILSVIKQACVTAGFKHSDKWIQGIKIVGSLTTYQYLRDADLDVHIIVDLDVFQKNEKPDLSKKEAWEFLDNYRKLINKQNTVVEGTSHPLELYFETEYASVDPKANKYDVLKDTWIKPPTPVSADFDLEEIKPFIVDLANELAGEIDKSLGNIWRNIKRIDELDAVLRSWDSKHKQIFQEKIEQRLTSIEDEITSLVKLRDEVAQNRRKYDAQSEQEVKFKYLQRFGYFYIITRLKELLETDNAITKEDLPKVKELIKNPQDKKASEVKAKSEDTPLSRYVLEIEAGYKDILPTLIKQYQSKFNTDDKKALEFINSLSQYIPSDNKALYIPWILKHYLVNPNLDLNHVKELLTDFEKIRSRKSIDLNQFTVETLEDSIKETVEQVKTKEQQKEKQKSIGEVVYSEGKYRVLKVDKPKDIVDFCKLSNNTSWCVHKINFAKQYAPVYFLLDGNSTVAAYADTDGTVRNRHDKPSQKREHWLVMQKGIPSINLPIEMLTPEEAAKDPETAYNYAVYTLKGPFPEGEDILAKDAHCSYYYARDVIKGPWPKGEDAIAKDTNYAYRYAEYVFKLPEEEARKWGENYLKTHKVSSLEIETNVYTNEEMEKIYQQQLLENDDPPGDNQGGGNVYHDFNSDTSQYPKNPSKQKFTLDQLTPPPNGVLPDYSITWYISQPAENP